MARAGRMVGKAKGSPGHVAFYPRFSSIAAEFGKAYVNLPIKAISTFI